MPGTRGFPPGKLNFLNSDESRVTKNSPQTPLSRNSGDLQKHQLCEISQLT